MIAEVIKSVHSLMIQLLLATSFVGEIRKYLLILHASRENEHCFSHAEHLVGYLEVRDAWSVWTASAERIIS